MFTVLIKLKQIMTRQEKIKLLFLLFAILAMALAQTIGVASVMPFISLVLKPDIVFENKWLYWVYRTMNFSSTNHFLIFAGFMMFAIVVVSNTISAFATWLKLRFAWTNNYRLSKSLLEKYLSMPYIYFLNQNSSDLRKNVLSEVKHLTNSYMIPILTIFTRSLIALFLLIVLFLVDVWISLAALIFLGGSYGLILWRVNRNLKYQGALRMNAHGLCYKAVDEAFGGIKEIKIMNRELYFLKVFAKHSMQQALLQSWNDVIGQIPRYAMEIIASGGIILFVLVT